MSVHLNKEIGKLKRKLLHLSALVEEDVRKSVNAVTSRNTTLARKVIESDQKIDDEEIDLEEECLKILALYKPVAIDLRYVTSCMKINIYLERIGDLAVNIAKRAISISHEEKMTLPFDFSSMMDKTQSMFKNSLDALIEMDSELAYEVCKSDDEIDQLNKTIRKLVIDHIKKEPEKTEYYLYLLNVSKCLERIADHATNISEDVIYMIDGQIIRHHKGEEH